MTIISPVRRPHKSARRARVLFDATAPLPASASFGSGLVERPATARKREPEPTPEDRAWWLLNAPGSEVHDEALDADEGKPASEWGPWADDIRFNLGPEWFPLEPLPSLDVTNPVAC